MAHGRHGRIDHLLAQLLGPPARAAGLYGSGPLNLGVPDDYRVPDQAYLRSAQATLSNATAALVVEVVSPGDESRQKFDFYFRAGVEELLIVDPGRRTVEWFTRSDGGFVPSPSSPLLGLSTADLAAQIDWPD